MEQTAGLRREEGEAWVGFLRVHATLVRMLDKALQDEQGLSLGEFEVLLYLSTAPEQRRRLSDIAERSLLSLSGMSRMVDRLERAGMVERVTDPEDRRGTYITLTESGRSRLLRANEAHERDIHDHFARHFAPEELRQMADFWERLVPGSTTIIEPFQR